VSHVSRAIFTGLKLRELHPNDRVVLAFPDVSRVRNLFASCLPVLTSIHIEVWLVGVADTVTTFAPTT
jgi:hypothetical protein